MIPNPADVERIAKITNPVMRNLQITACYHDLSQALVTKTGNVANWCTFATWASRQAGQSIRHEDLKRKLYSVLHLDPQVESLISLLGTIAKKWGRSISPDEIKATTIGHLVEQATIRSGDAVARGNKKVFEEIGWHFARFLDTCLPDQAYNEESITSFCNQLRTGDPPDGQLYLHRAFRRYYQSLFESNVKKAEELRFYANIEIGFHEQTRLQPEITEALNAAAVDPEKLLRVLTGIIFSADQTKKAFGFLVQWVEDKTDVLKGLANNLSDLAARIMRKTITEQLMTLTFPPGHIFLLGRDVIGVFPEHLMHLEDKELGQFLILIDPTPDSLVQSGAIDWSDLKERLHFICDLFRCFHQKAELFSPAFTTEQWQSIQAGKIPALDW